MGSTKQKSYGENQARMMEKDVNVSTEGIKKGIPVKKELKIVLPKKMYNLISSIDKKQNA